MPDCSSLYHHSTIGGYCPRCGETWKSWRRKRAEGPGDGQSPKAVTAETPQPDDDHIGPDSSGLG